MNSNQQSARQNLLEPNSLGEFAFALCVTGIALLLVAGCVGGMIFAMLLDVLAKEHQTVVLWALVILVWLLLQAALILKLRRHARTWPTIVRDDRQMHYVEWSTIALCGIGEWMLREEAPEVVQVLRGLFGLWMLTLVASHVVTYALFRARPTPGQTVTWTALALAAAWVLRSAAAALN